MIIACTTVSNEHFDKLDHSLRSTYEEHTRMVIWQWQSHCDSDEHISSKLGLLEKSLLETRTACDLWGQATRYNSYSQFYIY